MIKILIKYAISSSIAVLTLFLLLRLMVEMMGVAEILASNISFLIAATVNYFLQHNFVYNCEGGHGKHASRFAMVTLTGLLINHVVFSQLLSVISFYLLAQFVTLIIVFVFGFIVNTAFTFRKEVG